MSTLSSQNTESTQATPACEYWFLGTMRKLCIKMEFLYAKAIFHMMGYHDGTQNFMIEKYGVLAFK